MCIDCCCSICCFTLETSACCIIEVFFVSEPNECDLVSIYSGGVPNCMRWVCRRSTKLVYSNAFSGECFLIYWVCWLKEFHNTNDCYPNHGSLFLCAGLEELEEDRTLFLGAGLEKLEDGDDDASEMSEDLEGDGDDSETSGDLEDDSEISEDDVEEDGDD